MIATTKLHKPVWHIALGMPLLVAGICFFITQTEKFHQSSTLISNAIVFDMLVSVPLLYYLITRKHNASRIVVLRVLVLCLFLLGLILDSQHTTVLHYIKTFVYPLIELVLLLWIGRSFYLASQQAKQSAQGSDFLALCRDIAYRVIGNEKVSAFFASEIASVYYAFNWEKAKKADYQTTFSIYKDSGIIALLYTLMMVLLVETAVTHLLLEGWNAIVAWVATGLGLYTCLPLLAHIRAIKMRPIVLEESRLKLYNGLAAEVVVDIDNIEKIACSSQDHGNAFKLALLGGMESHNMVLHLKRPVQAIRIFGLKKSVDILLFQVDQPKDFLKALEGKLRNNTTGT